MDYDKKKESSSSYSPAAISESSSSTAVLSPPEMNFGAQGRFPGAIPIRTEDRDYDADFQRLQGDGIESVREEKIKSYGKLARHNCGQYQVYLHRESNDPWFIDKQGSGARSFEPYTQGHRDEVLKTRPQEQRKFIEFTGVKLKLLADGSPISVDNGGSVSVNGKQLGFSFNVTDGSFSVNSSLLPLGELSGNIYKFPTFGLEADLKPQLGPISFGSDYSFEVEIMIPGAPLSPSIILGGKLNQPAIKEDIDRLIMYDWFPFIGEILDALDN